MKTVYFDGFLRIDKLDDEGKKGFFESMHVLGMEFFYCTPYNNYGFFSKDIGNFLLKKLNSNRNHGYHLLDLVIR